MLPSRHLPFFLPVVMLAFVTMSSTARDAPPDEGAWRGVVATSVQNTVRVDLTIGGGKASMHFGEPANCRIVANHLQDADGASYYRFTPPRNGGGFCARLYPGDLTIDGPAPDSIAVVFQRSESRWAGILKRVAPTTE
jgi:hypothetical protein